MVHAAGESSPGKLDPGTNAVVLAVDSEQALLALAARLAAAGVEHVLIREPDAPWCGQATAIGLAPVADRAPLRPLLSTLPLLDSCRACGGRATCAKCAARRQRLERRAMVG